MADYDSSLDFNEPDSEDAVVTLDALDQLDFADIPTSVDAETEFVLSKINALEQALLTQHPSMPTLCQTIHKHLLKHPEITSVLREEDLGTYIAGLKAVTGQVITAAKAKAKGPTKKELAKLTLDDLI